MPRQTMSSIKLASHWFSNKVPFMWRKHTWCCFSVQEINMKVLFYQSSNPEDVTALPNRIKDYGSPRNKEVMQYRGKKLNKVWSLSRILYSKTLWLWIICFFLHFFFSENCRYIFWLHYTTVKTLAYCESLCKNKSIITFYYNYRNEVSELHTGLVEQFSETAFHVRNSNAQNFRQTKNLKWKKFTKLAKVKFKT